MAADFAASLRRLEDPEVPAGEPEPWFAAVHDDNADELGPSHDPIRQERYLAQRIRREPRRTEDRQALRALCAELGWTWHVARLDAILEK